MQFHHRIHIDIKIEWKVSRNGAILECHSKSFSANVNIECAIGTYSYICSAKSAPERTDLVWQCRPLVERLLSAYDMAQA